MEMTLRWYGEGYDSVTLNQIRQIPGVTGVISTLYGTQPGEEWKDEEIKKLKSQVETAGLHLSGIESVNIADEIKTGDSTRDLYIERYIRTLEKLGQNDIHMVCYNFMPVFDWTRSDLAKPRPDGSNVLAYDQKQIDQIDPQKMFESMDAKSNGFIMPGWEPERLEKVKELFEKYAEIDEETLFENLVYFLNAIMPVCDKYDINMAIHPDDPAWPVFGLPRIVRSKEHIMRLLNRVDNPHNGLTFCTGSFGSNPDNDLVDMIYAAKGRIHFAHVRNIKYTGDRQFEEAAHLSSDGSLDMYAIMKALYDTGFDGPIRPDHGRMIWDEKAMPGYGLYDRALGAAHMKLEKKSLREAEEWKKAGYELPEYDLDIIQANTKKKPTWIHFGAGNIFRAFMAVAQQKLLNEKISDTGIIVCEGYDSEIIEKVYRKYDNLTIAVSMKQNGSMDKMVVGSVAESLLLKPETSDWLRLKEIFENPALQMATFTITEKGYQIKNASGYLPQIKEDMQVGPEQAKSYMGCLTALCYLRYLAGKLPLALVSMDNFSHNGDRLKWLF